MWWMEVVHKGNLNLRSLYARYFIFYYFFWELFLAFMDAKKWIPYKIPHRKAKRQFDFINSRQIFHFHNDILRICVRKTRFFEKKSTYFPENIIFGLLVWTLIVILLRFYYNRITPIPRKDTPFHLEIWGIWAIITRFPPNPELWHHKDVGRGRR